jgi:hypothetical protein
MCGLIVASRKCGYVEGEVVIANKRLLKLRSRVIRARSVVVRLARKEDQERC